MDMQPYVSPGWPILLWLVIGSLAAWDIVWRVIALWQAARRDHLVWYVALLVFSTVGILPIIYIFAVAPRHPELGASAGTSVAET